MREDSTKKRFPKMVRRLVVEMTEEDHSLIKKKALMRNQTMRKYVLETLKMRIDQEKKYE